MKAPTKEEFEARFREFQRAVEETLDRALPPADEDPPSIHEAMRYSVFGKAKRLRPVLAMAVGEALGADPRRIGSVAAALELIHTYSLIHDDLPCMDDDDLRRGMPTCHVKYGEATAVLAGDALLTHGFESIIANGRAAGFGAEVLLEVIRELSEAAGSRGMISGQILDLEAEGKPVGVDGIRRIHALKTGRLFVSSVRIGALLAGANPREMLVLTGFAEKLGQVFQIVDDILDVIGTTEELGKTAGIDAINEKATYPGAVGLERAWEDARALGAEALGALGGLGRPPGMLPGFVSIFLDRRT